MLLSVMEAQEYNAFGSLPWPAIDPMGSGDPLQAFMNNLDGDDSLTPAIVSPGAPKRPVVGGIRRSASGRGRSSLEQKQRAERERAETEAIESFAAELSIHPQFGRDNQFSPETRMHLIGMSVPTAQHVRGRRTEITVSTDLAFRSDPLAEEDDDDEDEPPEDWRARAAETPLVFARKCFKGKAVSSSELDGLTQREKFSNYLFLSNERDDTDGTNGTWVHFPTDAQVHRDGRYRLAPDAFGERAGLMSDVVAANRAFTTARSEHECAEKFMRSTEGILEAGAPKAVHGIAHGLKRIRTFLKDADDMNMNFEDGPSWGINHFIQQRDTAERLRQCIMKRMLYLRGGRRINDRIQTELNRFRSNKPSFEEISVGNIATLVSTFTTDDLMKYVADHFGPYDSGRLLRTCKWADDITKLFKSRFPRLHIYRIPQVFPHHVDAGGFGYMHAQSLFKVAVGMIYTKKREPLLDGSFEQDPGETDRPGVQCFDVQNTVIGAKNIESWTGFDQPWDPEMKRTTIHPSMFFQDIPTLQIVLIDATTNQPVVPLTDKVAHGGMVPDKVMARRELLGAKPRLKWSSTSENPSWRAMQGEDFAVMSKFKADDILSSRINSRFKIRAEAVGQGSHGSPLRLVAESDPFVVVSSLAVAKRASYTNKRKRNGATVATKNR